MIGDDLIKSSGRSVDAPREGELFFVRQLVSLCWQAVGGELCLRTHLSHRTTDEYDFYDVQIKFKTFCGVERSVGLYRVTNVSIWRDDV
ncbi:unnamed protein product [Danaus chrysippus]|uniref:(African queen) hypothetical protein n=1 Tax=Danaus chrysippus TaxID=151541 RepID=A0A8J2W4Y1_9NEOP|nr:unnamed protein product [Danaus chrysippus]